MHWDTFKQDNYSTVGVDGGCRVGEVRVCTTSPMPDHKGLSYSKWSEAVGIRSTVVERATHMQVYTDSSPTCVDHRKKLI